MPNLARGWGLRHHGHDLHVNAVLIHLPDPDFRIAKLRVDFDPFPQIARLGLVLRRLGICKHLYQPGGADVAVSVNNH